MTTSSADAQHAPRPLPSGRWLLALGLLTAEYVVALFLFDSERLPIDTGVFALVGKAMPLVIVVMTAAFLIGGGPSQAERRELFMALRQPRRVWPYLIGHMLTYASSLAVTVFVFNAGLGSEQPWLWIAIWMTSAICSVLLLAAAVIPVAAVRPLRRPVARALVSGTVVGVLALLAGSATSLFWRPMSRLTLEVVSFLLALTGHEVVGSPHELIVGTPAYTVFIDRQCSGYEGIGLITVLLGFYLFLFRKSLRFPNALLLVPIGMLLIWFANGFRIAALIAVGTWISPEIAEGGFHSAAGWLLFCAITLGLVAVSRRSGWLSREERNTRGSLRTPEGAFLLPLLFLIATSLVGRLFTTDFDYLYPLRVVIPLIPLWLFRDYYKELRWSLSWTPWLLGGLVFVLWVLLEPPAEPESVAVIPGALADMPRAAATSWLVARILGSVVVVPIAEELAFRGYLLRRLIHADFITVSPKRFTWVSFLVSSAAFGLLHDRWLAGTLAGMVYAGAQYKSGRITDAIVAHAVTNGLIAAYVLAFGAWTFW